MVTIIAKFGVKTKELDDGLDIYGIHHTGLKTGASIHCYDDHRVAMAFSVLGVSHTRHDFRGEEMRGENLAKLVG